LPTFRKRDERVVHRGSLITVAVGTFEAPDGETFQRDLVHHPGAVSVVPLTDDGRVLMVRQYRAAVGAELLEIPAGKRDVAGEAPAATAARELAEEVGMAAGSLALLTEFFNSPGFCDERSFVYLATGLTPCPSTAASVEERHMAVVPVPLAEVPGMIAAGELTDAKSIIGLCLARERLPR
jgi:8-oxo-dGTP pyrophosphatase MutT (NUDIX family)